MNIEIASIGFALRPYKSGECWQLYERRKGKDGTEKWMPVEYYPGTVQQGLLHILELSAKRSPARADLRQAISEIQAIREEIIAAVR
jgi:hypothetical protein